MKKIIRPSPVTEMLHVVARLEETRDRLNPTLTLSRWTAGMQAGTLPAAPKGREGQQHRCDG